MNLAAIWSRLRAGEHVEVVARGSSMVGLIDDRDTVVIVPCVPEALAAGDIVCVRVGGKVWLHKVARVGADGRLLIANNRGRENGWAPAVQAAGIVVSVNGRPRPRLAGKLAAG